MEKNACHCESTSSAPIRAGMPAPDFTMEGYFKGAKKQYSLKDFAGKWVLLFFYPLDFTFVCPTELIELNKHIKDFEDRDVQVLGVSVDSVYSHEAWCKKELGELHYPLLSDMTKKVSRDYNVLIEDEGISLRGAFLIDPKGKLESYTVNDLAVGRSTEEILRLVDAFESGDLCPADWHKGDKTLGKA